MNIFYNRLVNRFCRDFGVSKSMPFEHLPNEIRRILMNGTTKADEDKYGVWFEGVIPNLMRRWKDTESEYVKERLHSYFGELPCTACDGADCAPKRLP